MTRLHASQTRSALRKSRSVRNQIAAHGASRDRLTKERRSWNMSRIRGKNTTPEIRVRSLLHRLGFRFRIHGRNLPGKPDVVLAKYKTVVFVHGCFWHRHKGCKNCTTPTNRRDWWLSKLEHNVLRDRQHHVALRKLGWRVIVIWECEIEDGQDSLRALRRLWTNMQGPRAGHVTADPGQKIGKNRCAKSS